MSLISSVLSSFQSHAPRSPGDRMQSMLQSAVSSGSVLATDQTALSGAIDDIGSALRAGASSTSASAGTAASTTDTSDPASMKDKVAGLIDKEVSDGKLTSDQATELKDLFAKAATKMAGHGHNHGPPPASSDDTTATASSSDSLASDLASAANDAISALTSFLDKLKISAKSNAVYGASGSTSGDISSLLVNSAA